MTNDLNNSEERPMGEERFENWAIVELMGHVRMAGRVTEEERFGAKMGRIDIPFGDGLRTQYFGGPSVYRLTPVTEDVARAVASQNMPQPVHSWEMPRQLAPGTCDTVAEHDSPSVDEEEEMDDRG